MQQTQKPAPIDPKHFWGFKHVIERSGSGYSRKKNTFTVQDKPLILAHIGSDTPQAVSVEQSLGAWDLADYQPLTSLDEFFRSLSIASDPPRIYILRSQAGIEQSETWIGFGFEETDRTDLKMLPAGIDRSL